MKFIVLFLVVAMVSSPVAQAADDVAGLEETAVQTMLLTCVPSLVHDKNPAAMALERGFSELPPERVAPMGDEGARVFRVPKYPEKILVVTKSDGTCSVAVQNFNSLEMTKYLETYLGVRSAFTKATETDIPGGVEIAYQAKFPNGKQGRMSASLLDKPAQERPQGLLVFRVVK